MKSTALLTGARDHARLGLRSQHLPLVLLIVVNLAVGLLVFRDYGLSWDEPLFYQYADSIGYAYSLQARLAGSFDLEQAFGPSAGDHQTYGPAYLLVGRAVVRGLGAILPARTGELWHLTNFLLFQVGLLFFYALARLFVDRWAAFAATLLFTTQPVLWGYAWINPKDVPFMVFFMGAIWLGIKMVDRLAALAPARAQAEARSPGLSAASRQPARMLRFIKGLRVVSGALLVGALVLVVFWPPLQGLLSEGIRAVYSAPGGSLVGRLFAAAAPQASQVPVESYIHKSLVLFARLRLGWVLLSALVVPLGLVSVVRPSALPRGMEWLKAVLAPLPAAPDYYLPGHPWKQWLPALLLAAVALGLLASIRVLGPLAGVLVGVYFLARHERRAWTDMGLYALVAFGVMFITWPYLWEAPFQRLLQVARHMSSNPQILSVVFNGDEFPSNRLPAYYLPMLLGFTLTEPVWLFFTFGLAALGKKVAGRLADWRKVLVLLLWFFLPFLYVVLATPPMYDGYRHFLFILPPVFLAAGFFFQVLRERVRPVLANVVLLLAVLPGLWGMLRLHPYQYTYFNTFAGGTGGAFRRFETDFWLTCYREIIEQVNENEADPVTLFVHRQPEIAVEYAAPHIDVRPYDADDDQTFPGSLLLLSSRTGVDYKTHPEAPVVYQVGREGAVYCLVRLIQEE